MWAIAQGLSNVWTHVKQRLKKYNSLSGMFTVKELHQSEVWVLFLKQDHSDLGEDPTPTRAGRPADDGGLSCGHITV